MRSWVLGAVFVCAGAGPAVAQYGGNDPCQPAAVSGNAIVVIANLIGQARRDQACAELRRAQWAEYNARQKAAHDAADTQDAATHERATHVEAEQHRQDAPVVQDTGRQRARHQAAAAGQRARQARGASQAQSERDAAALLQRRRQVLLTLSRAEAAPDNHCREPALARGVMQAWDGLDAMKSEGVRAIDIEHLTTLSFDGGSGAVACHGVFVTDKGWRVAGTATLRKNVAGDPMFVWERDADQDLSAHDTPREAGPSARETVRQVHVEQSVGPADARVQSVSTLQRF